MQNKYTADITDFLKFLLLRNIEIELENQFQSIP
jgi:hypothetical protein